MKDRELKFAKKLLRACNNKAYVSGKAFEYSSDKQLMYYLDKWAGRNWWEYGVSLRTGWFTPEGINQFRDEEKK